MPSAAFADAYTAKFGRGMCSCTEVMFTIEPPPCSRICRAADCASRKLARTSTLNVRSKSSTVRSRNGFAVDDARVVDEHVDAAELVDDARRRAAPRHGGIGEVAVNPRDAFLPVLRAHISKRPRVLLVVARRSRSRARSRRRAGARAIASPMPVFAPVTRATLCHACDSPSVRTSGGKPIVAARIPAPSHTIPSSCRPGPRELAHDAVRQRPLARPASRRRIRQSVSRRAPRQSVASSSPSAISTRPSASRSQASQAASLSVREQPEDERDRDHDREGEAPVRGEGEPALGAVPGRGERPFQGFSGLGGLRGEPGELEQRGHRATV